MHFLIARDDFLAIDKGYSQKKLKNEQNRSNLNNKKEKKMNAN